MIARSGNCMVSLVLGKQSKQVIGMVTLLIAVGSEELADSLIDLLEGSREIRICSDGNVALEYLKVYRPDQMILDLSIPYTDGMSVLRNAEYLPPVILALSNGATGYAIQAARDAGAGLIMQIPCRTRAIVDNLEDMVRVYAIGLRERDPQNVTADHLRLLNVPSTREGFRHLRVGVPLYRQDRHQSLTKELYSAIAEACGNDNGAQVETAIRNVIGDAWVHRNKRVWDSYFPGNSKCPTNKQFIAGLAEKLE